MPSATVTPESIRFPQKCPHCGGKPAGTYAVAAVRGLDAFVGSYAVPLLLDVPVCREAFDRRHRTGLAALVTVLLVIVVSGGLAVWLAIERSWLPAAVLGAIAVLLGLGGRTGWDSALLDRQLLGASARSESSTRVRVRFARDDYFKKWMSMNPSATQE